MSLSVFTAIAVVIVTVTLIAFYIANRLDHKAPKGNFTKDNTQRFVKRK